MKTLTVSKSEFKPKALHYLRLVQTNKRSLIITHHNKPVAKVIPLSEELLSLDQQLNDSVLKYEDPFEPVGLEDWEALK